LPFIPKFPPGCAHLDLREVERVLIRHRANISEAAKELGVSRTDLRKLTWHKPKLLEEALLWCGVYVSRCDGLLIQALDSKSRRRREWAVDKLMSSRMGYGHLLSSAPREALVPAQYERAPAVVDAQVGLEREAAAELERERAAELESDRRRERERESVVVEIERSRKAPRDLSAPGGSLWPAGIRRPSKRGWR
jgi:hypothetical protein